MSTNFLPPTPIKDNGNKWRNIVGFALLAVAVGGAATWQLTKLSPEITSFAETLSPIEVSEEASAQVGGDITVEPPAIPEPKLPELIGELPDPAVFSAAGMVVKDAESGALLYAKKPYDPRAIASITKLMSALVILEKVDSIDWNATATVIGGDSLGTHMYAGDTYTLAELWDAALIASSNKAILTFANAIGWPEAAFIERMNQKAMELGMSNTRFEDPTGLGDKNISTASDVSILLREALSHKRIQESLTKAELDLYSAERGRAHHMWNTNWLLLGWIPHDIARLSGGKTGYTEAAGYSFTVQVSDSAGNAIDIVVLGTNGHEARFTEARDIALATFANYQWP